MSDNKDQTTSKSFKQNIIRKLKRFFLMLCVVVAIIIAGTVYWRYFYTYSDGYRAGLLQKFSRRGNLFKTYEGEMILSSITSSSNVALASEKFNFSVINKNIWHQMDTLQGQVVIVHYIQKKKAVFWRGDSEYRVDSVRVRR